jgi:hypothetical protein
MRMDEQMWIRRSGASDLKADRLIADLNGSLSPLAILREPQFAQDCIRNRR